MIIFSDYLTLKKIVLSFVLLAGNFLVFFSDIGNPYHGGGYLSLALLLSFCVIAIASAYELSRVCISKLAKVLCYILTIPLMFSLGFFLYSNFIGH
jgi:hypothetical protein